ncbi:MAG: hypothetical protein ACD_42C00066G0002 [uncultured bacterium]|nr:MAG: hypothetical protein ACD_42C00066G0002 [uncultured bacterium]OGT33200.1 MAG: hypothetical protein A3C44_06425 [Gammaproteobacteria bacterium RIFCSPHIGHO2_02_FULL_39_13]OGT49217.1 MAG: hypothetical protein A3E53_07110 [Gammaproteobacteria bacterium RIFCSPHIGHO2_12_FULL_39_24]
MKTMLKFIFVPLIVFVFAVQANAFSRGIYLTQDTVQNKVKLAHLIQQAKKYGIDTFVIDINIRNKHYPAAIKTVLDNGIQYVARVVVFPHGATRAQINDKAIWEKRLGLVKYAIELGASSIQLDYIRYRSAYPATPEKAQHVLKVVQFFKDQLASYKNVKLQMDIFGIAAHKPAHTIGQDPNLLATVVNAFCPMVYPSHYEPFRHHAIRPYETIYASITALKKQIQAHPAVAIYAYIELFNYRYPLSSDAKTRYIVAQMKAAKDSGADGYYVWSATNHYAPLFRVLAMRQ